MTTTYISIQLYIYIEEILNALLENPNPMIVLTASHSHFRAADMASVQCPLSALE
jgi:hypothetical protein